VDLRDLASNSVLIAYIMGGANEAKETLEKALEMPEIAKRFGDAMKLLNLANQ